MNEIDLPVPLPPLPEPRRALGHVAKVAGLTALGVQAATAAGLVGFDAWKKRGRRARSGFPRPGTRRASVGANEIEIITFGADLYEQMLAAIDGAVSSVYLETYIWKDDEVGQRFKEAVNGAAARGVDVKIIVDGTGNLVVDSAFYTFGPGVQFYRMPVFRPRLLITPVSASGLTHRKLLIVDDRIGFVGGYNIGSLYATQWRDTHIKLTGPEVWELRDSFEYVWNRVVGEDRTPVPRIPAEQAWSAQVRTVDNIPMRRVYPIRAMYLEAIGKADHHIYATTPYFIPDQHISEALVQAAQRGVDVRLIMPAESNHVLADVVSRGYWRDMLEGGVTVLLYEHAMIHAKTMTIDGIWSTIGTANLDRISLGLNYEVNVEIIDASVAAAMEEIFEVDASNCHTLTPDEWARRGRMAQFAEVVLAPFAPLM